MNDMFIKDLRKKYPKKGPNPGKDIQKWAREFMTEINFKIEQVFKLQREKKSIDDIAIQTGLRKETVSELINPKRKRKEKKDEDL